MADFLPPVVARLMGDTKQFNDSFGAAPGTVDRAAGAVESRTSRLRQSIGTHFTAISGVVTGSGYALAQMGADSEKAEATLRQAIENTGKSMGQFQGQIGKTSERMIGLGFDDEDAARGMAKLATATQDPQKAIDSMGLVADIAASKHISLEAASGLLAKAMNGNARAFKEFGVNVAANASPQERAAALMELQRRVAGQAQAQHENFAGTMSTLRIRLENFGEAIGSKVGPAMTMLGPMMMGVSQIAGSGLPQALGRGVVGLLGFGTSSAAAGAEGAAGGIAFNLAWLPVIAAIAAIVAAGYLLYTNWDTVFAFVKGLVQGAYDWVRHHLELIAAVVFLPIAPLILLATHWHEVWNGMQDVARSVVGGVETLVKGYVNTILGGVNFIIRQLDKIEIHVPSVGIGPLRTPGFDWDGLGIPEIPLLARGGTLTMGGLAVVGDAGPELLNLPRGAEVAPLHGGGGGAGVINLHVHIEGTVIGADKRRLAEEWAPEIRTALLREGDRQALGLPA